MIIKKHKPSKLSIKKAYDEYDKALLSELGNKQPKIGIKHDSEKPDMSLLSSVAMLEIAKVMTHGKKKYSAHNWRNGISYSRLIAAALRHTFAYLGGEDLDPESGISHIAHASCCLMMLLEFVLLRPELDDRWKTKK